MVDGLNVCLWVKPLSLETLLTLLINLREHNNCFICVFDASSRWKFKEVHVEGEYEQLITGLPEYFFEATGGIEADEFILIHADKKNISVISNDRYRKYIAKYEWLMSQPQRLIKGGVMAGELTIPSLNIVAKINNNVKKLVENLRQLFSIDYYIDRGDTFFKESKYNQAIADYTEALRLNPESARAYGSRGDAYRGKKEYDQAIADYTEALRLNPNSVRAYNSRGDAYRGKKEYDQAIADYTEALRLNPESARAIASRGETYHALSRYDEALADFDRAIALDKEYDWAIANRGWTYYVLHRGDEALADFDRAIALNAEYAWAIARRGATYHALGRYDEAKADYTEALRLNPKSILPPCT
jgi:tetratricopeptide (TPR) repeat protein